MDRFGDCEPVYETVPGWTEPTAGVTAYARVAAGSQGLPRSDRGAGRRADRHRSRPDPRATPSSFGAIRSIEAYNRESILICVSARSPTLTLSDLKPGDRVRIESIDTADPAVQRLMVLGLVEGAELDVPAQLARRRSARVSDLRRRDFVAARAGAAFPRASHGSTQWPRRVENARFRVETLDGRIAARRGTIAVVGNPNAGKSSVFNRLTGLRQRTANYPGVTVERRIGRGVFGKRSLDLDRSSRHLLAEPEFGRREDRGRRAVRARGGHAASPKRFSRSSTRPGSTRGSTCCSSSSSSAAR